MASELNPDIAGTISELDALMKKLRIKKELYKIIFRGKGLEFDGYRVFSPDDDASDIDWIGSSRANELLVRQYIEERDIKVVLAFDYSENMLISSGKKLKCEYSIEVSACLAHLVISSQDNFGFALFNEGVKEFISPKKGISQFRLFVDEISDAKKYRGDSNIEDTLSYLINNLDNSISVVIIVSDFLKMRPSSLKLLKLLSSRFEVIGIMIRDPIDDTLPNIKGEIMVEDSKSGEQILIDPSVARKSYEKYAAEQKKLITDLFKDVSVDLLSLEVGTPFVYDLVQFLNQRAERKKFINSN
ncbi:MAG: DUF58 domain-containing protein [Candidatus Nanoarchaeia archaeon]